MDGTLMLVDLPGYGFAKRSGREREDWGRLVDDYFGRSQTLGHLLLLCDIRHDASQGDLQMAEWLQHYQIPYTLIATKADKIAKSKRKPLAAKLAKQVGTERFVCFSSLDGSGKQELASLLDQLAQRTV